MANVAISAKTVLIAGVSPDSGTTAASGETATITGPGGGPVIFDRLVIRAYVATAGATLTIGTGDSDYSGYGLGSYAVTVATAGTAYIGGKDFESARFLTSAESVVITCTSRYAGSVPSVLFEAVHLPSGVTA